MQAKQQLSSPGNDELSTSEDLKKLHPVVAIGTSAGGLKALYELFENLPPDLGMTYIIIQHLSPNHQSILPDLVASKTEMKVHQVTEGVKIEKDNVYVIPPNTFMSIADSKLVLSERVKTNSVYHSIDFFFTALAPIYQSKAIGIVLSGSGTDGTVGVEAIKNYGGITFAQDETAAFEGMPKHASDSGFTDFVFPCKRIAQELTSMVKSKSGILSMNELVELNDAELKKIQALLHTKKGVDFGYYKQTTVNRRIMRRMALHRFSSLPEYTKLLRENTHEVDLLYKDLLINVTSFFRDGAVYTALVKKIFPSIFKTKRDTDVVRIWTPACANGEEAYSIAICLFEYLKEKAISTPIQIFGTDLNEAAIDKARTGVYYKSVMQNVSPQRLKKYFIKTDGQYQIIKAIRDVCIFATHNLLKDPPFSRMDIISCQNVFIYLETNPQRKILQAFHYALKPTGHLLLGKSESIGNSTELFHQVDKDLKIYSKKQVGPGNDVFDFSLRHSFIPGFSDEKMKAEAVSDIDIEKEADRLLLSRYVPASVVINKDLQILRFHGPTSNYLQPSSGRASLHLLKMVKDELVFELKGLINRAKKEGLHVAKDNIRLSHNGVEKEISIEVLPVKSPVKDFYFLVLFKEAPIIIANNTKTASKNKDNKDERLVKLEQQLSEAREYMKTMSEEFEATREELQSSNEEVLSSNEELQSINEELETSKEELQSTNEELTTINEELQQRNADLKEATDNLQGIIETINEPLLVLGTDLRIKTANNAYYTMFKTNIDGTEGYSFFDAGNGIWDIPELKKRIVDVALKGKSFDNCEITKSFPMAGEKTFLFNAIRMQHEDNKKHKVLLVIQDITKFKNAERELKEREERYRLLLQNAFDIITVFSREGIILYQTESLERTLGYADTDSTGKNFFELSFIHPDDVEVNKKLFEKCLKSPGTNVRGKIRLRHANGSYKTMEVIFRNMLGNDSINGIIGNYQDVTDIQTL